MEQWKFAKHIVAGMAQKKNAERKYLCLFMVSGGRAKKIKYFRRSTLMFFDIRRLFAWRCNLCKNEQLNDEEQFYFSLLHGE